MDRHESPSYCEMKLSRRTLLAAAAALALADVPPHHCDGYDFGPGPAITHRLNQGPFGIDQVAGWFTIATTTPSDQPIRNWGLRLMGYTWEENGPSLAARPGRAAFCSPSSPNHRRPTINSQTAGNHAPDPASLELAPRLARIIALAQRRSKR